MCEYKKISEWAKEIGLVPGMVFSVGENSDSTLHIVNVDNNLIKFYFNYSLSHKSIDKKCNIQDFDGKYNLIYDPRNDVKNNTKEYIQKEILKKESELATLKEKLKELNKFKFEVGKVYKVIFDGISTLAFYKEYQMHSFIDKKLECVGYIFNISNCDDGTYLISNGRKEKLEYAYEILGNPTLSNLVSGNYKLSENLMKKET